MKASPKFLGIMCGAVALLGLGGAYWQSGQKAASQTKLDQLLAQMRNEDEVNQELADSQVKLDDAKAKLEHLSSGVVAQAFVPRFMKGLEELGLANQITVTGVRPKEDYLGKQLKQQQQQQQGNDGEKKALPPEPFDEMLIEFQGSGEYFAFNNMLQELTKMDQIVRVESIDIQPRQKVTGEKLRGNLELTVTLKCFIEKEDRTKTSNGGNA